jgi:DNA polymerase-3 subunit alpha
LHNLPEIYEKSKTTLANGEMLIKPVLRDDFESKEDLDATQFDLLGISFKEHPIIKIKSNYKGEYSIKNIAAVDDEPNTISHVLAILVSHRDIKTKTGQVMAFAKIEDDTKIIDVAIFPGVYNQCKSILNNGDTFIVTVKPSPRGYQALSFKKY